MLCLTFLLSRTMETSEIWFTDNTNGNFTSKEIAELLLLILFHKSIQELGEGYRRQLLSCATWRARRLRQGRL
jgi:hypothetical protein